MAQAERFHFFFGSESPCSNWHSATFALPHPTAGGDLPLGAVVPAFRYNCVEQRMMHAKALMFGDKKAAAAVMASGNPKTQKELGRKVVGFDEKEWTAKAFGIVKDAVRAKFDQNPALRARLLAIDCDTFVEASPYDRIWGIGLGAGDARARNRAQWRGTNLLGRALTEVRDELRAQ